MKQDTHLHLFRHYSKGNAEVAVRFYCQKYGSMTQEEKLTFIEASDQRLKGQAPYSDTYNEIEYKVNEFRIWFCCCEWLKHGQYTEYSCVYYQRRYQDGEQDVAAFKKLALDHGNCPLYGYPGSEPTKRFFLWPGDGDRQKLDDMKDSINYRIFRWGLYPAVISDIRVWPLKYDLNADPEDCCQCLSDPKVCVPGAW